MTPDEFTCPPPGKPGAIGSIVYQLGFVIALLGIIHFSIAMLGWLIALYAAIRISLSGTSIIWSSFWSALPAPVLFAVFLAAVLLRQRRRLFGALLCCGIAVTVLWSTYDAWHQNWQIHATTDDWQSKRYYVNWPWMNELDVYVQKLLGPPPRNSS